MAESSQSSELNQVWPGGLVPLSDWQVPTASVQHTLRDALRTFSGYLRESILGVTSSFEVEPDIASLSAYQLRRFAPQPNTELRAESLQAVLQERWRTGSPGQPNGVTCLVTPPHSGLSETLALMAASNDWQVIAPPDQLLMNDEEAEAWWASQDLSKPWVIPELARFWRRHRRGLALLRALFARLAAEPAMPALVGCSSWCWSFWTRYLPELGIAPITLAPMTSEGLQCWLPGLPGDRAEQTLRVRQANNGHWVIPGNGEAGTNGAKRSDLLRDLAALARGNPGVALAIWQKSLRARPDESLSESEEDSENPVPQPGERACWVIPLEQLSLPSVGSGASRTITGVLHALLLHDGLQDEGLEVVLSQPLPEIRMILQGLRRQELIEQTPAGWCITALAYPSVRRTLQSVGYPVDGF